MQLFGPETRDIARFIFDKLWVFAICPAIKSVVISYTGTCFLMHSVGIFDEHVRNVESEKKNVISYYSLIDH